MIKCGNPECENVTTNKKFCSRACSAKVTNLIPKRKRVIRVCRCGTEFFARNPGFCPKCKEDKKRGVSTKTLQETFVKVYRQPTSGFRYQARRSYKRSGLPMECRNCGYSKHVEVCHIRGVKDFPEDTPLSVVNDPSNLMALCPNCHWEFDHNILSLETIVSQGDALPVAP